MTHTYQNGGLLETTMQGTGQTIWRFLTENGKGMLTGFRQSSNIQTGITYDTPGYPQQIQVQRTGSSPTTLMTLGYTFNAVRGFPTARTNSVFSWSESFSYDNLDRLTVFNDNNGSHNQGYDTRGRITSSSRLGTYSYSGISYRQSGLSLTPTANTYYQTRAVQDIDFNAFKSPNEIHEPGHDRYSFQYNGFMQRASAFYGGVQADKLLRPKRKHYSSDGSMEISKNLTTGTTDFIFYLGGEAYSALAVWKERHSSSPTVQTLYYLQRDYLGSIVLITDASGNAVEKRQFDAWGNIVKLTDGSNNNIPTFAVIDRGYTGHEHLQSVGLIHMNARLYDPLLGRFVSPDNYVQDPLGTQNYNRYAYAMNNPLMYVDQNGEFFEWSIVTFVYDFFRTGFFKGGFDPTSSAARSDAWRNFDPTAVGSLTNNAFKISFGNFKTDPNKSIFGRTWELVSRFTWQAPQHSIGYSYSSVHNLLGGVKSVDCYGGATVVESYSEGNSAVTIGNFIVGDRGIKADPSNPLFQHEYGHYIQSQKYGVFYFSRYGIPSLLSKGDHNIHPVEQDANARALKYFNKHISGFSDWSFDFNPIIGYNISLPFDHQYNQEIIKGLSIRVPWYNYVFGPDIIGLGGHNARRLNRIRY